MSESENRAAKGSTVSRVLDILATVTEAKQPITPTELAEQLKIPKASAHRLCTTLEEAGFFQSRLNSRGLVAGPRMQRMALDVLSRVDLQADHRAILARLSAEVGETCNLAVPDGVEMIYYDRVETHWPVRVQLQIGSRVPLHATASGKMYLSSLPVARRKQRLDTIELNSYTDNTITDRDLLLAQLKEIDENGFSTDNEEYIDGMVALAVPVKDAEGRLYATLSFQAPCMRVPCSAVTKFLPAVNKASADLSAIMETLS